MNKVSDQVRDETWQQVSNQVMSQVDREKVFLKVLTMTHVQVMYPVGFQVLDQVLRASKNRIIMP
jgi:hypothetical protein